MKNPTVRTLRSVRDTGLAARSFVLQLSVESDASAATFAGRIQHLETLDGGNFDSADALVAIIRRVLERARRDDDQTA